MSNKDIFELGVLQKISCGENHLVFLTRKGEVFVGGSGKLGILGLGMQEHVEGQRKLGRLGRFKITEVECGEKHTLCLSECGRVFAWG